MAVYLHEFLYRGRPEKSTEVPAWHIMLVSEGVNDFGDPTRSERTLNMVQAEEAGWPLPKILETVDAAMLAAAERRSEHEEADPPA